MLSIELERHPSGPRLRVRRQRVHHGAVGAVLLCFKRTRLVGFALCAHDAHDAPRWFQRGAQL